MVADLHLHTTASDGSNTPEELVKLAKKKKINTIAIADHDTIDGIEPALRAGNKAKIEVLPAIEFSTFRGKAEIHILGYFIDYTDKVLLEKINKIFQARINRAKMMIKLLNELGIEITFNEVKMLAGDKYIGRPHIARAMVKNGYIEEIGDAFNQKYIGNGGRAYVPKYKISPEEAIKIIKKVEGIPVLAHPVFINHGDPLDKNDIRLLKDSGLMGIEVFHSKHNDRDQKYYQKIAEELELVITGGSDYHGENSPDIHLGDVLIEDKYVNKLKKSRDLV
ncbi:MAG: PHP domain-containing protein [Bacillota bacterium]